MSIEAEFRSLGIVRGGVLLLDSEQAVAMVRRAYELGVGILGVDGFWITEQTTQPDIGHSIDLSDAQQSWSAATQFIEERSDQGLVFEVVLDEPEAIA